MKDTDFIKDIEQFEEWDVIEPIDKGWSNDIKFYIVDKKGDKFLLRLSNIEMFEKKKLEYEDLINLSKLDINMTIPVKFGICDAGKKVYIMLTWLDGKEAIDIIPSLSAEEQYKYGVEAGKILQKIHSIKLDTPKEPWNHRYKRKLDIIIKAYGKSEHKINNYENIINFIKENFKYLNDRPYAYQHGDFVLKNMIITEDGKLGVIDFNKTGYGDPWEDYDRFVFSWGESKEFAIGQIHGYFDNNVPDQFFRLISLYNARNAIASVPWTITFGNEDLETTFENIKKVYDAYDGFTKYIPKWYREP